MFGRSTLRHSSSKAAGPPFRIFGSPVALQTHQMTLYLRHLKQPFVAHTSNVYATFFASCWYKSKDSYCALSPSGKTLSTFFDLVDDCERRGLTGVLLPLNTATHPALVNASCLIQLYSCWWLMCVAGYFRWVDPRGSSMVAAHASYFSVSHIHTFRRGIGHNIAKKMVNVMAGYGVTPSTGSLIENHFKYLCAALEKHFAQHAYILGTMSPTLADVSLAASFNGQFIRDDGSRGEVFGEDHPHLVAWLLRMEAVDCTDGVKEAAVRLNIQDVPLVADVTEAADFPEHNAESAKSGVVIKGGKRRRVRPIMTLSRSSDAEGEGGPNVAKSSPTVDALPATLEPFIALILDVLPWMVAQCDALKTWYAACEGPPTRLLTLPSYQGSDGPVQVLAYEVPRMLEQTWLMTVDDMAVECDVSLFHVSMAQRMTSVALEANLDSTQRLRPDAKSIDSGAFLPDDAAVCVRDMLLRCDTKLNIAPATLQGVEGTFAVWKP